MRTTMTASSRCVSRCATPRNVLSISLGHRESRTGDLSVANHMRAAPIGRLSLMKSMSWALSCSSIPWFCSSTSWFLRGCLVLVSHLLLGLSWLSLRWVPTHISVRDVTDVCCSSLFRQCSLIVLRRLDPITCSLNVAAPGLIGYCQRSSWEERCAASLLICCILTYSRYH